ncbi:Phospholipid carrier-dependent glycosyltransferase [Georgfuchsia toluolica]|uniref:Phospholipid carrier-dependent glycosyltransferase n=1 Tax=Georgfuchsia toluolica TaxID=424218 RepID=A0A916NI76_9PROT|nr:glycosyltransferase family 39 protein [Georgfuchsia toluolica]CAG4884201.1 Phospholipid carrier-dependent glycosyltransferase [Georgfuchsia toluolica]
MRTRPSPRKIFFWALAPLLVFRLWLAAALPITGDEAYFIWWGKIPDWGFYDHPPMIGWWLAAQLALGEAAWWLRLTSVLQPFVIAGAVAFMLPRIWPEIDDERRWWATLFTLLAPAAVWNVLITTDTPLIYFSVFSGLAWLRAGNATAHDDSYGWYLLAGVFLAGAVLSKYFVAFLGFAYLVDALWRPSRRKLAGLILTYLCILPALALMAWWNAGHCWPNVMFNFINRHGGAGLSWQTPLLYLVTMGYLLTPPVVWRLARAVRTSTGSARTKSLVVLAFVPLALFALLSLVKTIGLHWVLSFLPFVFMLLALKLENPALARIGKFILGFAALHVVAFIVMAQLPLETLQRSKWYNSAVLAFEGERIAARLKPYEKDYVLASDGYADAATQGWNSRHYFFVFGEASSHARHDDVLTDFRPLEGRNILILKKSAPEPGEYAEYFHDVRVESFTLRGTNFYLVLGHGFNYPRYRASVLATVKRKYYAIPAWLPQTACYFCQRYFPEASCRR